MFLFSVFGFRHFDFPSLGPTQGPWPVRVSCVETCTHFAFPRSATSECGVTQHTTTTIQYERYNTDGAKICSQKQRTKYDRRYDEEANRARRRGSVSGKPERHTRENFHTHYDSSPTHFRKARRANKKPILHEE